ncbi:MAG: cyclic nucleotide-binding domain-containing protein [Clostridia bacterium]|nr:cyclic nucleotide-binding domain-containing protein [Clostridia bacterium]
MEILQQNEKMEVMIRSIGLSELYSAVPRAFHLARFQKGELLTGPTAPLENLLFLAEGSVHIYGLRENGSSFSVYLADQRTILGDFEFLQHTALPFYTEAAEDVLCILLDARHYRRDLEQNVSFLRLLLESLSSKFRLIFFDWKFLSACRGKTPDFPQRTAVRPYDTQHQRRNAKITMQPQSAATRCARSL